MTTIGNKAVRGGPGAGINTAMVDNFAIGLTHALMLLALWRILSRAELDAETSARDRWQPPAGDGRTGDGRTGDNRTGDGRDA